MKLAHLLSFCAILSIVTACIETTQTTAPQHALRTTPGFKLFSAIEWQDPAQTVPLPAGILGAINIYEQADNTGEFGHDARPGIPRFFASNGAQTIEANGLPTFAIPGQHYSALCAYLPHATAKQPHTLRVIDYEWPGLYQWDWPAVQRAVYLCCYPGLGSAQIAEMHERAAIAFLDSTFNACEKGGVATGYYGTPFTENGTKVTTWINSRSRVWIPVTTPRQGESFADAFRRTVTAAVTFPGRGGRAVIPQVDAAAVPGTTLDELVGIAHECGAGGLVVWGYVQKGTEAAYGRRVQKELGKAVGVVGEMGSN